MSPEKNKRLLEAVQNGTILDEKTLAIFNLLEDAKDLVDKAESVKNELETKINESKDEILKEITPSGEDILNMVKSLMPEVKDGHTPTDSELLLLIKPLIPKVRDGHTPTKKELLDLIKPLVPNTVDIADLASKITEEKIRPIIPKIDDIENDLPKLGPKIRDGLEILQNGEKLSIQAIQDLPEILEELKKRPTTSVGSGFNVNALNFHIVDDEAPVNTGDDLNFTIASVPSPVSSVKIYRNGQRLKLTTDYTFSGRTITLLIALQAGETLTADYRT